MQTFRYPKHDLKRAANSFYPGTDIHVIMVSMVTAMFWYDLPRAIGI